MRTRTAIVFAVLALFATGCTSGKAHTAATATPVGTSPPATAAPFVAEPFQSATPVGTSPPATAAPFVAEPFQPATWPIATKTDLQAYRARPASMPWATDRVAVAEHFARDVLKLSDVRGVAHCVNGCTDVDLYVAGQHVGGVALVAERDAPSTVYSALGVYSADVGTSVELGSLGDPAVAFGTVRGAVGMLQVSLRTLTGTTLASATTTTAPGKDWTAVLSDLPNAWGRGVLVVTSSDRGKLTRLLAVGVQQQVPTSPATRVRCQGTDLAIVSPSEFHVGYTGDSSFGFYVANTGKRTCVLSGYASLTFTTGTTVMPFKIVHGSGMGYHDPGPHPVTIQPGGAAVFAVDKYRCDEGSGPVSTTVRIRLPGLSAVNMPMHTAYYCTGGPAGNTLTVTALAATRAELNHTR